MFFERRLIPDPTATTVWRGSADPTVGAAPSDPLRTGLLVALASAARTDGGNGRHQSVSRDAAFRSEPRLIYIEAALQICAPTVPRLRISTVCSTSTSLAN